MAAAIPVPPPELQSFTAADRDALLGDICAFKLPPPLEAWRLNFLLIGPAGAGKSAIINSLHTAMHPRGVLSEVVEQGGGEEQLTRKFSKVLFRLLPKDIQRLKAKRGVEVEAERGGVFHAPFCILDTMGWWSAGVLDTMLINNMMSGRMMDGHPLSQDGHEEEQFMNPSPTPADKVHCMIAVIPASEYNTEEIRANMAQLVRKARAANIPLIVALTKVDAQFAPVKADAQAIATCEAVHSCVCAVAATYSIKACNIVPLQLYGENPRVKPGDPAIEIPLLNLVWKAACASEDRLRQTVLRGEGVSPPSYQRPQSESFGAKRAAQTEN